METRTGAREEISLAYENRKQTVKGGVLASSSFILFRCRYFGFLRFCTFAFPSFSLFTLFTLLFYTFFAFPP